MVQSHGANDFSVLMIANFLLSNRRKGCEEVILLILLDAHREVLARVLELIPSQERQA
jgi:hypothetical protein